MSYSIWTNKSWASTRNEIADTMRKWGVRDWELEKVDGLITTTQSYPREKRRVTLRYVKDGVPVELVMDKQTRIIDNARVLYLAVEAMRMNDARGITDVVREAYAQLPAPKVTAPVRDPYQVLGVSRDADMETIEALYRLRVKKVHPDTGGTTEAFTELQRAMDAIRQERGG